MRDNPPSFTCAECGAVSHHPRDAAEGYCGRCRRFTTGVARSVLVPREDGADPGEAEAVLAAMQHGGKTPCGAASLLLMALTTLMLDHQTTGQLDAAIDGVPVVLRECLEEILAHRAEAGGPPSPDPRQTH